MRELGYETLFLFFNAFNPDNYRRSTNNFFGSAREAGLLFMPAGSMKPAEGARAHSAIVPVESLDDLALCILRKPQYKWEVLAHTAAANTLGTGFFANEIELAILQAKSQQQIARLNAQLEAGRKGDEN